VRKNLNHIKIEKIESDLSCYHDHDMIDFAAGFPPFMRGNTTCNLFKTLEFSEDSIQFSILESSIYRIENQHSVLLKEIEFVENKHDAIYLMTQLLQEGLRYIQEKVASGIFVDAILPKLVFSLPALNDVQFQEALHRASRMFWAKSMQQLQPKNPDLMKLNLLFKDSESKNKYKTTTAIDPWAGSYYFENLTFEIFNKLLIIKP
jgi:hypothetical protein